MRRIPNIPEPDEPEAINHNIAWKEHWNQQTLKRKERNRREELLEELARNVPPRSALETKINYIVDRWILWAMLVIAILSILGYNGGFSGQN